MPNASAIAAAMRSLGQRRSKLSRFQRASAPMPTSTASGAVSGMKTLLKYGGPTEILPRLRASTASGYRVPSRILAAATTRNTLLSNRPVSRDSRSKRTELRIWLARRAYSASDEPTTAIRNSRMNTPRSGSEANACTDVRTPERTRKVPSRLRENAKIASSTVQALNAPRFSVTASECISAVPTSQGMNDAFSTGSQNHQPPQPSS